MDSKIIIGFDSSGIKSNIDKCVITIINVVNGVHYVISSVAYMSDDDFYQDLKSAERLFNTKPIDFTPK